MLNGHIYASCPKATFLKNPIYAFMVEVYFQCRDSKTLPCQGSLLDQTNYAYELFRYLDSHVNAHWDKENQKREYEHSRMLEQAKNSKPGRKA